LLSTAHAPLNEDGSIPTCQRKDGRKKVDVPCPPLLPDYVTNMRGVDRGDQMIALYNSRRKSVKVCLSVCLCPSSVVENNYMILSQAWKSMLWYMLEYAILNAFLLKDISIKDITSNMENEGTLWPLEKTWQQG
jgi:lauroyl/myristoyl acyltransferase